MPVNIDNMIAGLPQIVKKHPSIKYSKYPAVFEKIIAIL